MEDALRDTSRLVESQFALAICFSPAAFDHKAPNLGNPRLAGISSNLTAWALAGQVEPR